MTALLASVRSLKEVLDAAAAGADFIDLKEPRAGALGGVHVDEIGRIVLALGARYPVRPISATIGDFSSDALERITGRVLEVAIAGVDYVKVGVEPGPHAEACLQRLAALPACVVPILLCDHGIDLGLVAFASQLGFAGVVFDTALKERAQVV